MEVQYLRYPSLTCPQMLAGHASGCWRSQLGAGVPYNREKNESLICTPPPHTHTHKTNQHNLIYHSHLYEFLQDGVSPLLIFWNCFVFFTSQALRSFRLVFFINYIIFFRLFPVQVCTFLLTFWKTFTRASFLLFKINSQNLRKFLRIIILA